MNKEKTMNWLELAMKHMIQMAKVSDETIEYHYGPETLLLLSIAESLREIAAYSKPYTPKMNKIGK